VEGGVEAGHLRHARQRAHPRARAGYGFTREPDLLYQLSRHTGEVLAKTPLKSGPERLALDELGVLHVRTYDRDVGFQLSR